jgi:hypothetical protein
MTARSWRMAATAAAACGALAATACGTSAPGGSRPASGRAPQAASGSPAGPAAAVPQPVLAARYLAIARPANERLDHDFDGLGDASHDNLQAAAADLRAAAATERTFDRQLMRLALPAAEEKIARIMVLANQARARLSDEAAAASTLTGLHHYLPLLTAANAPVEDAVRVLRSQLRLPPPETS